MTRTGSCAYGSDRARGRRRSSSPRFAPTIDERFVILVTDPSDPGLRRAVHKIHALCVRFSRFTSFYDSTLTKKTR